MKKHPDSRPSLKAWVQNMEANYFKNPVMIKQTFRSADYVKPYWVFNISGNKYRLIALIDYLLEIVAVEGIYTHSDYDRGKWR